jgi:hypothetical protein
MSHFIVFSPVSTNVASSRSPLARVTPTVILLAEVRSTLYVPTRGSSAGIDTVSLSPLNSRLVARTQPVARASCSGGMLSIDSPTHLPDSFSCGPFEQPAAAKARTTIRATLLEDIEATSMSHSVG